LEREREPFLIEREFWRKKKLLEESLNRVFWREQFGEYLLEDRGIFLRLNELFGIFCESFLYTSTERFLEFFLK
jgi:hypothetical protein